MKITTILSAALLSAAVLVSPALAGSNGKGASPQDAATDCLSQVSVTYKGEARYLKPGIHYKPGKKSDDPDVVSVADIALVAGLLQHPLWGSKETEIKACLALIPNLRYVDRTDN